MTVLEKINTFKSHITFKIKTGNLGELVIIEIVYYSAKTDLSSTVYRPLKVCWGIYAKTLGADLEILL